MSLKRKAADSAAKDTKKAKPNGTLTSFFGPPKDVKAAQFVKEDWVKSLTPEQKDLLKLEIDTLHESWLAHLKDEILRPEFLGLKRFLKKEKIDKVTIYPPEQDIYSWYIRPSLILISVSRPTSAISLPLFIDFIANSRFLLLSTGPATAPSTPSKSSSSAKIPTTTPTKRTVSASPSRPPPPRRHPSRTSTKSSNPTTTPSLLRPRTAVC